jgi:hypothetical protein
MNSRTDASDDTVPAQQYAALYVALGWLRSELYSVMTDEVDKTQIQRLLDSTTIAEIARVVGKKEEDLTIDYNHYLAERQKHEIGGTKYETPDEE